MDKKIFIDQLFKESSSFNNEKQARGFASLLNTISSDIYSESQRFVFELIQNADDSAEAGENEVLFEFLTNALIVYHNGKVFSEGDINSITDAGASTKIDDPTKTGYKGIGFKSVFGKSDRVSIFSDGYQFRFDKSHHTGVLPWQIIPIWSEIEEYSEAIQHSLSSQRFNVATIIELSGSSTLAQELREIISDGQILLFLRYVSKITVAINGEMDYSVSRYKQQIGETLEKVSLHQDAQLSSEWLVRCFDKIQVPSATKKSLHDDTKTPEKLLKSDFTQLSFAAQLVGGKIRAVKNGESLIYTYLPTKVREFNFPFLVNGSFLTSAAREALFEDRAWNQWLFSLIGQKAMSWLTELSGTEYRLQLLNILPVTFEQNGNELKKAFDASFQDCAIRSRFITTVSGGVGSSLEVLLDGTGLSLQPFLERSSIVRFISEQTGKSYTEDCFVHQNLEAASKLKTIGVETFDAENIGGYFRSKAFTESHGVSSNFDLIKYLKTLSDADKSGIWFQALKELPFVFDEHGILRNPSNGVCFPTGLNMTELGEIPVVNAEVYALIERDAAVVKWLKELGVSEPSDISYVTNVITPGLKDPDYINEENFYNVTSYLFKLFQRDELNDEMLESLRELRLKVIGPPAGFVEAQQCFLSDRYRPRFSIQYLITSVSYVSEEYLVNGDELGWNKFFRAIHVKEDIEIETINENNSIGTLEVLTNTAWVTKSRNAAQSSGGFGYGRHNRISNLNIPSFLHLTAENYDYCVIFWKKLIDGGQNLSKLSERARFLYGEGRGYNNWATAVDNYFPWFVHNVPCIPTSTGELKLPAEVYLNSGDIAEIAGKYLPVFRFENTLPIAWKLFFKFRDRLELEDYLAILTLMWKDAEADEPAEKVSLQRIGMIYNKLAQIVEELADANKIIIRDWALENKVLSGSGKFDQPAELKWVTIEGFSDDATSLKTVRVPSNTRLEKESFLELMELFGVQIISEFQPDFNLPVHDISLISKLERVLPMLVAIAVKKNGGDEKELFEKLYRILDDTTFYSACEIKLYFEFNGNRYEGPVLSVYRRAHELYFKGKWRKERTLLNLIRELILLMKLKGLDSELRFLLMEEDREEINEWLQEQHISQLSILPAKTFTKKIFDPLPAIPSQTSPVPANTLDYGDEEVLIDVLEEDDFLGYQDDVEIEIKPFSPTVSYRGINFNHSGRQPSTSKTEVTRVTYEKVEDMEYRAEVGRWSEGYINELLISIDEFTDVQWMNQHAESGKPYDFIVRENGVEKYVEVKGTQSLRKNLIYLSKDEWSTMYENKSNYVLFRVYGAGTENHRFDRFDDPFDLIQQGAISVALEL